jgi:uncharacterized protein YcbX
MDQLGTLETISRYPVKSMAGEELERAFVGYSGMMGDRIYAFVRANGPKGFPWHTGRDQEDLLLFHPRFRETEAVSVPADIEVSFGFAPGVNPLFPPESAFDVDVATPDGRVLPVRSMELATELEHRNGHAVSLRSSERSLYDCRPISILGNATVRGLGDELGMPIDRRRFRANFYVDWIDDRPYRENDLLGRTLQVGERLRISIVERDPRCKMITIDPETAETEPQILRHVNAAHGGTAGIYAAVLLEGVVRKGDAICLVG